MNDRTQPMNTTVTAQLGCQSSPDSEHFGNLLRDEAKRLRALADQLDPSGYAQCSREQCVLQNQIEIMGALSLLLRYAQPDLVGKSGELDRQRDDLLQRHKATQRALSDTSTVRAPTIDDVPSCGQENDYRRATPSTDRGGK